MLPTFEREAACRQPKGGRAAVAVLALCVAATPARAADLGLPPSHPQRLFSPTNPEGVAAGDLRSPIADVLVNGDVRFAGPAQAQARCPNDVVVWVELGSNHVRPAERRPGAFMCEADASIEGDRP